MERQREPACCSLSNHHVSVRKACSNRWKIPKRHHFHDVRTTNEYLSTSLCQPYKITCGEVLYVHSATALRWDAA